MPRTLDQIKADIQDLSEEEHAELVAWMRFPGPDPSIEDEWLDLAAERARAFHEGRTEGIPAHLMIQRLREKYRDAG